MPTITVLYSTGGLELGTFRCPPADPAWREENTIGDGYHVAFPGTPVLIAQARARPVVTNMNHAVFYNHREAYRRGLLSERGDECAYIRTSGAVLRDVLLEVDPRLADREGSIFPFVDGPIDPSTHLLQRLLVRYIANEAAADRLAVEETVLRLLGEAIGAAARAHSRRAPARSAWTEKEQAELVERAKSVLTQRLAERLDLHALAAAVHSSPYHLARVFRSRTGYALHEYRNQLRLRSSLSRLTAPERELTGVALEYGFASHSHYSDAFRKSFAMSPSAYRRAAAAHAWPGRPSPGRPGRQSGGQRTA